MCNFLSWQNCATINKLFARRFHFNCALPVLFNLLNLEEVIALFNVRYDGKKFFYLLGHDRNKLGFLTGSRATKYYYSIVFIWCNHFIVCAYRWSSTMSCEHIFFYYFKAILVMLYFQKKKKERIEVTAWWWSAGARRMSLTKNRVSEWERKRWKMTMKTVVVVNLLPLEI